MNKSMLVLIYLFTIQAISQNIEMKANRNVIDTNYSADNSILEKLKDQKLEQGDLLVYAEKTNDSIFSIYVQNNTSDSVSISKQDGHLYLIQEARNNKNKWKPIEYWLYSWCGNSYSGEKLGTQKIMKTETTAYAGNFETEIRFKLESGLKTYYSNTLTGRISSEQFIVSDSVKKKSNFLNYSRIGGNKTATKIIFLDPDGLREYTVKNKKWLKWVMKKNRKRNKKAEKS